MLRVSHLPFWSDLLSFLLVQISDGPCCYDYLSSLSTLSAGMLLRRSWMLAQGLQQSAAQAQRPPQAAPTQPADPRAQPQASSASGPPAPPPPPPDPRQKVPSPPPGAPQDLKRTPALGLQVKQETKVRIGFLRIDFADVPKHDLTICTHQ